MSKAPQTVSLIPQGSNPVEIATPAAPAAPTCKTKLLSCFKSALPVIDGAISIGMDAASAALKAQIERDGKMNAAQKAALSNLTTDMLNGITTSVKTQLTTQLATVDADPTASALIAAATGVADAFAPGLTAAMAVPAPTGVAPAPTTFILPNIVTTTSQAQAALKAITKATGPVVLDLSHASGAVTLGDKAIAAMVQQAVRDSGLPAAHQKNLLKTGAAVTLVHSLIEQSNEAVLTAKLAGGNEVDNVIFTPSRGDTFVSPQVSYDHSASTGLAGSTVASTDVTLVGADTPHDSAA